MNALSTMSAVRQCHTLLNPTNKAQAKRREAQAVEQEHKDLLKAHKREMELAKRRAAVRYVVLTIVVAVAVAALIAASPFLLIAYLGAWFVTGVRPQPSLGLRPPLDEPATAPSAPAQAAATHARRVRPDYKKHRVAGRSVTGRMYSMDDVADLQYQDEEPF